MKIKGGSFSSMGLNKKLFYNIPYVHPTPIQRKALPLVLEGTDVMCISQTGSGKSLVYILPAIQRAIEGKRTFLIAPTRELCIQIHKMFKKLLIGINVNLYALTGHSDDKKHCKSNIVISTVGKLKYCLTELKEIVDVDLLVIDEVDRILEEGGMRSDLIDILKWIRKERQTVLVSATLPDECVVVDNEEDALFNENICSNNFFSGNKKSNLDENQDFSKTDETSNLIMEVESKNNDEKENKKVEKISELEKKTKHIDKYQKNFEVDIFKKLKYTQSVIFSDIFLQPLIENPVLVKIDVIVSELVKNYFFYLPDVCKEAAVVF
ncbi:DEAD/DEAH box helicase, partial [Hamiltosporidium magnivora]